MLRGDLVDEYLFFCFDADFDGDSDLGDLDLDKMSGDLADGDFLFCFALSLFCNLSIISVITSTL